MKVLVTMDKGQREVQSILLTVLPQTVIFHYLKERDVTCRRFR